MKNVNLKISIDSSTRRIDYVVVEGRQFNPDSFFSFKNGHWTAEQQNFPLQEDNDLDILIIAIGNKGEQSSMKVTVDDELKGTFKLYKPFNHNGYGQFNVEV